MFAHRHRMKKTHRKLKLDREVVRTLVEAELGRVEGAEGCTTGAMSTCSVMIVPLVVVPKG